LIVTGAIAIVGVASMTVTRAMPQTQSTGTTAPLTFETASLQRNQGVGKSLMYFTEDADGKPGVGPDGRVQWLTATNLNARHLLWFAHTFELNDAGIGGPYQIENAPAWMDSDRFDVVAKAPTRATAEQMHEMMRSLFAERFKLVAHRGSKEFPIYALVVARPDGSPGARMTPSQIDCTSKPGESSPCGLSGSAGRLTGRGVTMAQLVRLLPRQLGGSQITFDRPVTDDTKLSGAFDFRLEWTPDPVARNVLATSELTGLPEYRPYVLPLVSNARNFLAALQEQLGLRFDNQLAPEPVLIIDNIERPIEK
jgi:uncharacterized protein (TIGR03435 family)